MDDRVGLRLIPFPDQPDEDVGARILRSIEVLAGGFDRSDYDVVHAQDCITANAVSDCIRTIHHLDTFTTPELAACHERAIVTPYAHICVSQAVAAEVEAGWGLRPTVIGNGVDAERFAAGRAGQVAEPYVLSVGGIEPRKGTDDLVRAMALVQRRIPSVRLVIGGGETLFDYRDYRQQTLELAAQLKVEPVLLGPVAHDRMPDLMASAQVFAFPSTKEGFGLAAMEALAAGTPVVMRDLPVLREVFGDAVTYADSPERLADGLIAAITADDESRRRGGEELAFRHSWSAAATAHERFYQAHGRPADA